MKQIPAALRRRAKGVRLLGMDVDGVLTRGDVVILNSGEELKFWNAKDRLGLGLVRDRGIPLERVWITGRSSNAVSRAARDLGIRHVVQGCSDKLSALIKIMRMYGLKWSQVGFIGDDLLDLPVLNRVGFSACPADATKDVKSSVHYISAVSGGGGVVRDVLELILKAQNRWRSLIRSFI